MTGPWATVEPLDDGHCRLRVLADNLDWAAVGLRILGPDFTIVALPDFVGRMRAGRTRFSATAADAANL